MNIAVYAAAAVAVLVAVFLFYRVWSSYRTDPDVFMTALTIKTCSFFFSAFRYLFHISKGLIVMLLSAIYAISPIDFIPDVILGLGQIDDGLALVGSFVYFFKQAVTFPQADK